MPDFTIAQDKANEKLKRALVAELDGRCELCRDDPRATPRGFGSCHKELHHIARGIHRAKAAGKRFATLLLCRQCHLFEVDGRVKWPQSRQLALLEWSRPHDHNLAAFNALIGWGKDQITEEDVNKWRDEQ